MSTATFSSGVGDFMSENEQCPCRGTTLDKLVQPALLAVLIDGPLHGYELAKKIGEIPGFLDQSPDLSGIYRILKNLESRGMITSFWETPNQGRAKRLVKITASGIECLQKWEKTLRNYRQSLDTLHLTVVAALENRR